MEVTYPAMSNFSFSLKYEGQSLLPKEKNKHLVTMNGCSRSFVYFGRTASSFMRQRLTKFMKSIVKIFSTPLLLDVSWGGSPCTT